MPRIEIETMVHAPVAVVFDLSRSIEIHQLSQSRHSERAIGGRTSGLVEAGESVTWEAVHFWKRQRLTSRIVEMRAPHYFRDSMVSGAFARFDHDHTFEAIAADRTRIRDVFDFTSPCGILGRIADRLVLTRYMTRLLAERNREIKRLAESGEYERFLKKG